MNIFIYIVINYNLVINYNKYFDIRLFIVIHNML